MDMVGLRRRCRVRLHPGHGKIQDYVHNPQFMAKFVLIALAGVNMVVFHVGAYRNVTLWDKADSTPAGARFAGTLFLAFWIVVIFCGRWMGFVT